MTTLQRRLRSTDPRTRSVLSSLALWLPPKTPPSSARRHLRNFVTSLCKALTQTIRLCACLKSRCMPVSSNLVNIITAHHCHFSYEFLSSLSLRPFRCHQMSVPRVRRSNLRTCAYSVAGPTVWNSQPGHLWDPAVDSEQFRRELKTCWPDVRGVRSFEAFT